MAAAASRHAWSTSLRGLGRGLRNFGIAEGAAALLLASVFWAPTITATGAWWSVSVVCVVALATYTLIRERRLPPVPAVLVGYAAVYVLSILHASSLTLAGDVRFFTRVIAAAALAILVRTASQRRHVLLLILVFVGSQIPVAVGQITKNLVENGRSFVSGDGVTGLMGPNQAGILTLAAMTAAALIAGGWLVGAVGAKLALSGIGALLAIGVISSSRIVVPFVVVEGVAIAAAGLTFGVRRPPLSSLFAVAGAALLAAPLTYGGIRAIYPHAFSGLLSVQDYAVLGQGLTQTATPAASAPCGAAPQTRNLLRHGDFEGGVTGWRAFRGASISGDRQRSLLGRQSLKLVTNGSSGNESAASEVVAVCPGEVYAATAWVWAPATVRVGIGLSDGISEVGRVIPGRGRWERIRVSARVRTSQVFLEIFDSGHDRTTLWIDGVRLERGGRHPLRPTTAAPAPATPPARASRPYGVQLLPGRLRQLRIAARLSVHSGIGNALLGRGLGTSQLDPSYDAPEKIPLPQRTGSTYGGALLTETGWLGVLAFLALLVWVAVTGRTLWRSTSRADRALGAALPGVAALTAAGATYGTILQGHLAYAVVFWVLVGLAISALRDARRAAEQTETVVTETDDFSRGA